MRLALALILLSIVLITIAAAAAWLARRAEPLDYSADEIADADDIYLAMMRRGATKPFHSTPIAEEAEHDHA